MCALPICGAAVLSMRCKTAWRFGNCTDFGSHADKHDSTGLWCVHRTMCNEQGRLQMWRACTEWTEWSVSTDGESVGILKIDYQRKTSEYSVMCNSYPAQQPQRIICWPYSPCCHKQRKYLYLTYRKESKPWKGWLSWSHLLRLVLCQNGFVFCGKHWIAPIYEQDCANLWIAKELILS